MAKKRKIRPDYFEFSLEVRHSRLVTDHFTKNRRICLRGIGVWVQIYGDKQPEFGVSYPALGPLCRLVEKHPEVCDFSWDGEKRKWAVTNG